MFDWEQSITEIMQRYAKAPQGRGEPHFRKVAELSLSLYDQLQNRHRLEPRYRKLLWAAAMLHDIGADAQLRNRYPAPEHAWRSADFILDERIGCDEASPQEIATVVSLHGVEPVEGAGDDIGGRYRDRAEELWGEGDRPSSELLMLAAILRIADGFDRQLDQSVEAVEVRDNLIFAIPRAGIPSRLSFIQNVKRACTKGRLLETALGVKAASPDRYT